MPPAKPAKPKETRDELTVQLKYYLADGDKDTVIDVLCAYFTTVDLVLIRDTFVAGNNILNTNILNVPPKVTP